MTSDFDNSEKYFMWSIGVFMFYQISDRTPFDGKNQIEIASKIITGDYQFKPDAMWQDQSAESKHFIMKCLEKDLRKRLTIKEAL